MKAGLKMACLF